MNDNGGFICLFPQLAFALVVKESIKHYGFFLKLFL
ncbi:hypothetical protein HNQ69_000449 [Bartonella callosciuri]|uniref:Uncharacterized protein n=1 Tax=Bartonella callosciuri TaxID=686223 RepID=A0A840NSF2_9HYPH|nr:hypothetical protein [Bartonella callosciuri]